MSAADFGYLLPFIGIASYSIEGIGLVLPLRKDFIMTKMSNDEFKAYYFGSFGFIVFLYLVFGILNYLKFYDKVKTIIFYNYDWNNWVLFTMQILYAGVTSKGAVFEQYDELVYSVQLGVQSAVFAQKVVF